MAEQSFIRRSDVEAILADPRFTVPPPAPPGPPGTMAWLRASVARWSEGADHARRRALAERVLGAADPATLRARARERGPGRHHAVAVLAAALGVADADAAAALAARLVPAYATGDGAAEADEAVAQLLDLVAPGAGDEQAAARVALLVQAAAGLDTLIANAGSQPGPTADARLEAALRDDPPVKLTRRVAGPGAAVAGRPVAPGTIVVARLDDGGPSLAFGAGRHACPGAAHAGAIAAGIMEAARMTQDRRHARFAELHHGSRPLLLPNAWDHASAAALAARGFEAVATTSLGVAAAAGLPDSAGATRAETLALVDRIADLDCLLSVDLEHGFSEDPDEVAALAEQLAGRGVVGINLEDGRADGSLVPAEHHAAVVAAVKAKVPGLFVNARTDALWLRVASVEAAGERLRTYVDAGADGVFVPGASAEPDIAALAAATDAPLNVLFAPGGMPLARLGELGVKRVSTGSGLFRIALGAALDAAERIRDGGTLAGVAAPTYAEVEALTA